MFNISKAVSEIPETTELEADELLDFARHAIIIVSLRAFSKLLKDHPKLTFEAFSFLVEYYIVEIAVDYISAFAIIINEGYTANGVNFWLGETTRVIKYHSLICGANEKKEFIKKLLNWAKLDIKATAREKATKERERRARREEGL